MGGQCACRLTCLYAPGSVLGCPLLSCCCAAGSAAHRPLTPPPPARRHPTRPWRPGALRLLPLLLPPPCVQVAGGCSRMRHHWGPVGRHRTSPVARGGGRRSCCGRLWRPCPSGQLCLPPLVARAWQLRAAAAPMAAPTVRRIPQVWSRRRRQRMPRRRRQRRRPPPRGPQSPPTRRPPACARRLRRPSARLACLCLAPRPRLRALGVWWLPAA